MKLSSLGIAATAFLTSYAPAALAQNGAWKDLGGGLPGANGTPVLSATPAQQDRMLALEVDDVAFLAPAYCVVGFGQADLPFYGGVIVPEMKHVLLPSETTAGGRKYRLLLDESCPGASMELFAQVLVQDPAAIKGWAFSNAITANVRDSVASDFDGDGFSDLAVGVAGEDVQGHVDAGAVNVIYGSPSGLTKEGNVIVRPGKELNGLLKGGPEDFVEFGKVLGTGDFNGDGYDDLAAGMGAASAAGVAAAGTVQVIYGSSQGLQGGNSNLKGGFGLQASAAGLDDQVLNQSDFQGQVAEAYEGFGSALAVGEFNGDGFDDLVVGTIGEDLNQSACGVVHIAYGSPNGLVAGETYQDPFGPVAGDWFGQTLLLADLDADGVDELVVGTPASDVNLAQAAGKLTVIDKASDGSIATYELHRDSLFGLYAVEGFSEPDSGFGSALVAADFSGDGAEDLVVGVPFAEVSGQPKAGSVHLFRFKPGSLVPFDGSIWHQDTPGIDGTAVADENFGSALTVFDHDSDGRPDLAAGVPWESPFGIAPYGAVNVLRGDVSAGLTAVNDDLVSYSTLGLGSPSAFEQFGATLASGRFGNSCRRQLVIGVPNQSMSETTDGSVVVTGGGFPNQEWWQGSLEGVHESGDSFGSGLAGAAQ